MVLLHEELAKLQAIVLRKPQADLWSGSKTLAYSLFLKTQYSSLRQKKHIEPREIFQPPRGRQLRRKMLTMIPISHPTYVAARRILRPTSYRNFHKTAATMVKVGDTIPNVELFEGAPDKKVDIGKELASGKGLIVTIPAAYSTYTI